MNLKRWMAVILMIGLFLVLIPLGAQAEPYFDHPHGRAYGWDGPRHHGWDRHYRHFRESCGRPRYVREVYAAPPVAYVAPAPVIGIPYQQQQPYYAPQVPNGLHGSVTFGY
jgi:hypothetical protein